MLIRPRGVRRHLNGWAGGLHRSIVAVNVGCGVPPTKTRLQVMKWRVEHIRVKRSVVGPARPPVDMSRSPISPLPHARRPMRPPIRSVSVAKRTEVPVRQPEKRHAAYSRDHGRDKMHPAGHCAFDRLYGSIVTATL